MIRGNQPMTPTELELWRRLLNMDQYLDELAARRQRQAADRRRRIEVAMRDTNQRARVEQLAEQNARWVEDLKQNHQELFYYNEALSRAAAAAAERKRNKPPEAEHRERRSRIAWDDMIDNSMVVVSQVAWERGETVLAMREAGFTLRAIGQRFDLSGARIKQIADKALLQRLRDRRAPVVVSVDRAAAAVAAELKDRRRIVRFMQSLSALRLSPKRDWLNVGSP
jgi:hypothetical protein